MALTYFTVLDEILTEGGDYRDGDLIREKVRNRVIHGKMKHYLLILILFYEWNTEHFKIVNAA